MLYVVAPRQASPAVHMPSRVAEQMRSEYAIRTRARQPTLRRGATNYKQALNKQVLKKSSSTLKTSPIRVVDKTKRDSRASEGVA